MSAIASKPLQDIDELISKVSAVTGLKEKEIAKQLESANVKAFKFNDLILISPEDLDTIIDAWAASIKEELSIAPSESANNGAPETFSADDIDEDLDDETLSWPSGYEKVVTHLYTPTLNKILPDDKAGKKKYLSAIANQTDAGQSLAQELAKAIVKRSKRKLAYEKVLEGLIDKAQAMLAKL